MYLCVRVAHLYVQLLRAYVSIALAYLQGVLRVLCVHVLERTRVCVQALSCERSSTHMGHACNWHVHSSLIAVLYM